ncbi:MAG: hypothetical protein QM683_07225 [Lacrimispora sp.]
MANEVMNKRIGMYSSVVTLIGVIGFAVSMVMGSDDVSYLFSLFISWGFVSMICSFSAIGSKESKAAGYTAIAFSSVYAVLVGLVYFAQLTTLRLSKLSEQAFAILDYKNLGSLFFNYDLFGYAFMALSTFFIALTIQVKDKKDKCLKSLLLVHGVFAVSCVVMPILGVFHADMKGGNIIGVLVLEFWCVYFIPICILSYLYFKKSE